MDRYCKGIFSIISIQLCPFFLLFGLKNNKNRVQFSLNWFICVQYYEEMGKPTPKVEVMKYLKSKEYTDAKDYAGECESVVMIAKGQSKNTIFELLMLLFMELLKILYCQ